MNQDEAVEKLNALVGGDPEASHSQADDILLDVLRVNGFADVAAAYVAARQRVGFWYA